MERIVVIGNSGGGKSALARKLAAQYGLPYCEVDRLLWRPGWQLAPESEYATDHERWIGQQRWIIDGLGRQESIAGRLSRATDIVMVDLPLWLHFAFAAERQVAWATGRMDHPPADSAQMPSTIGLFKTIWEVDRNWMPEIRRLVAAEETRGKRAMRITSVEELSNIQANGWVG